MTVSFQAVYMVAGLFCLYLVGLSHQYLMKHHDKETVEAAAPSSHFGDKELTDVGENPPENSVTTIQ